MKPQYFAVLAGALLLFAALLLVAGPQPTRDEPAAELPPRVITVIGEGEHQVKPDRVTVEFGIRTQGASAAEAEASVLASVNRVREAMVKAGVEEQGLEAVFPTLRAITHQDYGGATRIAEFEGRASIRGVVRHLNKVQSVVDAALAAGATSLEGVAYQVENAELATETAMQKALDNARLRAGALAQAEGETLGELRSTEMLPEELPPAPAQSPAGLVYRVRVRATFTY